MIVISESLCGHAIFSNPFELHVLKVKLSFLMIDVIADLVASGGRYAEPSIRPDDSRYGENPNRLQRHTQFQVSSVPILLVMIKIHLNTLNLI